MSPLHYNLKNISFSPSNPRKEKSVEKEKSPNPSPTTNLTKAIGSETVKEVTELTDKATSKLIELTADKVSQQVTLALSPSKLDSVVEGSIQERNADISKLPGINEKIITPAQAVGRLSGALGTSILSQVVSNVINPPTISEEQKNDIIKPLENKAKELKIAINEAFEKNLSDKKSAIKKINILEEKLALALPQADMNNPESLQNLKDCVISLIVEAGKIIDCDLSNQAERASKMNPQELQIWLNEIQTGIDAIRESIERGFHQVSQLKSEGEQILIPIEKSISISKNSLEEANAAKSGSAFLAKEISRNASIALLGEVVKIGLEYLLYTQMQRFAMPLGVATIAGATAAIAASGSTLTSSILDAKTSPMATVLKIVDREGVQILVSDEELATAKRLTTNLWTAAAMGSFSLLGGGFVSCWLGGMVIQSVISKMNPIETSKKEGEMLTQKLSQDMVDFQEILEGFSKTEIQAKAEVWFLKMVDELIEDDNIKKALLKSAEPAKLVQQKKQEGETREQKLERQYLWSILGLVMIFAAVKTKEIQDIQKSSTLARQQKELGQVLNSILNQNPTPVNTFLDTQRSTFAAFEVVNNLEWINYKKQLNKLAVKYESVETINQIQMYKQEVINIEKFFIEKINKEIELNSNYFNSNYSKNNPSFKAEIENETRNLINLKINVKGEAEKHLEALKTLEEKNGLEGNLQEFNQHKKNFQQVSKKTRSPIINRNAYHLKVDSVGPSRRAGLFPNTKSAPDEPVVETAKVESSNSSNITKATLETAKKDSHSIIKIPPSKLKDALKKVPKAPNALVVTGVLVTAAKMYQLLYPHPLDDKR